MIEERIVELIKKHYDISILGTKETIMGVYALLREEGYQVLDTFCRSTNYPYNLENTELLYISRSRDEIIMESGKDNEIFITSDGKYFAIEPSIEHYYDANIHMGIKIEL